MHGCQHGFENIVTTFNYLASGIRPPDMLVLARGKRGERVPLILRYYGLVLVRFPFGTILSTEALMKV